MKKGGGNGDSLPIHRKSEGSPPGKPVEYQLQVYWPGSADDVAITFNAGQPFQAIRPGDIINPRSWTTPEWSPASGKGKYVPPPWEEIKGVLVVVAVEHVLMELPDRARHRMMIFTELAPDTAQTRVGRGKPRRRKGE